MRRYLGELKKLFFIYFIAYLTAAIPSYVVVSTIPSRYIKYTEPWLPEHPLPSSIYMGAANDRLLTAGNERRKASCRLERKGVEVRRVPLLHRAFYFLALSLYYAVCPLCLALFTYRYLSIFVSKGDVLDLFAFIIFSGVYTQFVWVLSQVVLIFEGLKSSLRPYVVTKSLRRWSQIVAIAREHGFALEKPTAIDDRLNKWGWYSYSLLIASEKCVVVIHSLGKSFIPFSSIPPRNVVVIEYKKEAK